jgi:hypothetical protein
MGNSQSIRKINFEDIQTAIKKPEVYMIINTLPINEQNCLIVNSVLATEEEQIINQLLKDNKMKRIIIYGKNANDETVNKKHEQLTSLGFYNTFIYSGGLFEWILLQDIYGSDLFPTTKKELDILKFKPKQTLNVELLEY